MSSWEHLALFADDPLWGQWGPVWPPVSPLIRIEGPGRDAGACNPATWKPDMKSVHTVRVSACACCCVMTTAALQIQFAITIPGATWLKWIKFPFPAYSSSGAMCSHDIISPKDMLCFFNQNKMRPTRCLMKEGRLIFLPDLLDVQGWSQITSFPDPFLG